MILVFDLLSQLAHLFHPRHSNGHRPKVLHPESIGFVALVLVLVAAILSWAPKFSSQLPAVLGFSSSITADEVIDQTNQVRRSQGFETLTYNAALTQAAQKKAENMLADHYWAHVSPTGKQPWSFMSEAGYKYRVAGENLARDFTGTPDMIQAWLNSPTHRANLLGNKYTEIGVAVVVGKLDDYETTLVVQMFGAPASQPIAVVKQGDALVEIKPTAVPKVVAQPDLITVVETAPSPVAAVDLSLPVLPSQTVLASAVFPAGQFNTSPVLSPKIILQALSLAAVLLLVATLIYDWFWSSRDGSLKRLVGHNLAHIIYLVTVAILISLHKSGWVY